VTACTDDGGDDAVLSKAFGVATTSRANATRNSELQPAPKKLASSSPLALRYWPTSSTSSYAWLSPSASLARLHPPPVRRKARMHRCTRATIERQQTIERQHQGRNTFTVGVRKPDRKRDAFRSALARRSAVSISRHRLPAREPLAGRLSSFQETLDCFGELRGLFLREEVAALQ
jgi:hypothetical protein